MSIDRRNAAGWVAVVLALSVGIALNVVTAAILWAAYIRVGYDVNSGISDKGVQILLAWGGGIISVLAGYVGFIVGRKDDVDPAPKPKPPPLKLQPPP